MKSVCFIIDDSNFNHWFKWCLVGFSKVTIFPFIVNKYLWGICWIYANTVLQLLPTQLAFQVLFSKMKLLFSNDLHLLDTYTPV